MGPGIEVLWEDWADRTLGLPSYATPGSAGADVRANLGPAMRALGLLLAPLQRALVPTGIILQIPPGYEAQIRPRSGLALRHGLTLANAPGTIDSDYRGPLGILLVNLGAEPYLVSHGERIAQIVVAPVAQACFGVTDRVSETARGAGGFGSTGKD